VSSIQIRTRNSEQMEEKY